MCLGISLGDWLQELALAVGACFDMDPEQAPEEALSQLEDLANQVDSLAERCTMLQACQQQFAVPQSDLKDPRELTGYCPFVHLAI